MILSLDVYIGNDCLYCKNLKIILKKLITTGRIKYPVNFIEVDDNQMAVPSMVKTLLKGNPQTLRGLPVRNLLYKFLEVPTDDEDEINEQTEKKTGKVFRVSE